MTCHEKYEELWMLYVLEELDDAQREELERHLDEGCSQCLSSLEEARDLAGQMLFAHSMSAPTGSSKRRLMQRLENNDAPTPLREQPTRDRLGRRLNLHTAALVMIAALLSAGVTYLSLSESMSWYRAQLADLGQNIDALKGPLGIEENRAQALSNVVTSVENLLAMLNSAATQLIQFEGGEDNPDAGARLLWDRKKNLCYVFITPLNFAQSQRPLGFWLRRGEHGEPFKAGEFTPTDSGWVSFSITPPDDVSGYSEAVIGYAPEGGGSAIEQGLFFARLNSMHL